MIERFALDALAIGIIVTGGDSRVTYANTEATALLNDGCAGLVLRNGRVFASDGSAKAELQTAISAVCEEDGPKAGRYIRATTKGGATDLAICVLPMDHSSRPMPRQAMLIVRPIAQVCNLEIEAQKLFGLTRSEARIASAIASGLSLQEAAEKHNVTLSTVRSQMKSVCRKTGVSRQSQVAALLRGAHIPVQAAFVIRGLPSGAPQGLASQTHRPD